MRPADNKIETLIKNAGIRTDTEYDRKVLDEVLEAFEMSKQNLPGESQMSIGRFIMKSRITKLAAIAAAVVIVASVSWFGSRPGTSQQITSFEFLAKARAAEQSLFAKGGIVHLVSEITVYPITSKGAELIEKLDDTKKSPEELNKINRQFLDEWIVGWMPIFSLQADGNTRLNRIKFPEGSQQNYTITDDTWYEHTTGRFARTMETDGKIIFANSYDGSFVYLFEPADNGIVKLKSEPVSANFETPGNPAEFLGLTAGVNHCLSEKCLRQPIQEVADDVLPDGTRVNTYKAGFSTNTGDLNSYWLFKVRKSDEIIVEIECIANGQRQMVIRRILSESADSPEYSWNLAELNSIKPAFDANSVVAVVSDAANFNISVKDLAEKAGFETYILAEDPYWTNHRTIVDLPDTMSVPKRMFVIMYMAQDNRHVILAQSETHNKYMNTLKKQIEAHGDKVNETTYKNGCKVWDNPGPVAWWTDLTLRLSGIEPAKDRSGYIAQSPSGTFVLITVNGQLTKDDLDGLVNSLIPAKDYQVK